MKKSKINKMGVAVCFSFLLIVGIYFVSCNVLAKNSKNLNENSNNQNWSAAPKECSEKYKEALSNYYYIDYEINPDTNYDYAIVTLFSTNGEFKITNITNADNDPINVYNKNEIINNNSVISSTKKVTLRVPKDMAQSIKVEFELNKTDNICQSKTDFDNSSGKEDGIQYGTFSPSIQVDLPVLSSGGVILYDNSPSNIAVCNEFFSGNPDHFTTSELVSLKSMYNANYLSDYREFLSGACNQNVTFVLDTDDLIAFMKSAVLTSYAKNLSSSYEASAGSSWDFDFATARNAAIRNGKAFYVDNMVNGKWFAYNSGGIDPEIINRTEDPRFSMECNYKGKSENDLSNLEVYATYDRNTGTYTKDPNKEIYNIHANHEYYYAKNESSYSTTYDWKYTSGKSTSETKEICKRTCEEVVEVTYGPPVASVAALCFEYQVQVSSKVVCNVENSPGGKPTMPTVCNPYPICINNGGSAYVHQGGSTEEFDECIYSCDGGKYSKDCSNKCFSKVYGSSSGVGKLASYSFGNSILEKISNVSSYRTFSFEGKYLYKDGAIAWSNPYSYSRYYRDYEYNRTYNNHGEGKYLPVNGFKRHHFGGENFCKDRCYFTGCSEYTYLNYDEAKAQYQANLQLYKTEIAKCLAAASCTEKTANFKISVSYTEDGKTNPTTIYFPYSVNNNDSSHDKLSSDDKNSSCVSNIDLTNESNKNHVLLSYDGCYKNCGTNASYNARWSFPMLYRNLKKPGEKVYIPGSADGYAEVGHKFCIPSNAKDVNQSWWLYYYSHHDEDVRSSETCPLTTVSSSSVTVEDYNINAATTNFGHFGWNLNISCFYALNSNYTSSEPECPPPPENSDPTTNYRVRSVDLKKLFPTEEDSGSTSEDRSRKPGFNWSGYANIMNYPNNPSLPSLYATAVEKVNYSAYSDDYLDYEFNLSSSDLRNIKNNYVMDYNNKKVQLHNGVYSYKSDLITNYTNNTRRPKDSVLGCINIKNYTADSCLSYSDLVNFVGNTPGGDE